MLFLECHMKHSKTRWINWRKSTVWKMMSTLMLTNWKNWSSFLSKCTRWVRDSIWKGQCCLCMTPIPLSMIHLILVCDLSFSDAINWIGTWLRIPWRPQRPTSLSHQGSVWFLEFSPCCQVPWDQEHQRIDWYSLQHPNYGLWKSRWH